MSRWTPCKRQEFVRRLRKLGFDGPFSGARHQFVVMGEHRLSISSNFEYSVAQVRMMIQEMEGILKRKIDLQEWDQL